MYLLNDSKNYFKTVTELETRKQLQSVLISEGKNTKRKVLTFLSKMLKSYSDVEQFCSKEIDLTGVSMYEGEMLTPTQLSNIIKESKIIAQYYNDVKNESIEVTLQLGNNITPPIKQVITKRDFKEILKWVINNRNNNYPVFNTFEFKTNTLIHTLCNSDEFKDLNKNSTIRNFYWYDLFQFTSEFDLYVNNVYSDTPKSITIK